MPLLGQRESPDNGDMIRIGREALAKREKKGGDDGQAFEATDLAMGWEQDAELVKGDRKLRGLDGSLVLVAIIPLNQSFVP